MQERKASRTTLDSDRLITMELLSTGGGIAHAFSVFVPLSQPGFVYSCCSKCIEMYSGVPHAFRASKEWTCTPLWLYVAHEESLNQHGFGLYNHG
eukprot:2560540-Amphidinium_carterae.2